MIQLRESDFVNPKAFEAIVNLMESVKDITQVEGGLATVEAQLINFARIYPDDRDTIIAHINPEFLGFLRQEEQNKQAPSGIKFVRSNNNHLQYQMNALRDDHCPDCPDKTSNAAIIKEQTRLNQLGGVDKYLTVRQNANPQVDNEEKATLIRNQANLIKSQAKEIQTLNGKLDDLTAIVTELREAIVGKSVQTTEPVAQNEEFDVDVQLPSPDEIALDVVNGVDEALVEVPEDAPEYQEPTDEVPQDAPEDAATPELQQEEPKLGMTTDEKGGRVYNYSEQGIFGTKEADDTTPPTEERKEESGVRFIKDGKDSQGNPVEGHTVKHTAQSGRTINIKIDDPQKRKEMLKKLGIESEEIPVDVTTDKDTLPEQKVERKGVEGNVLYQDEETGNSITTTFKGKSKAVEVTQIKQQVSTMSEDDIDKAVDNIIKVLSEYAQANQMTPSATDEAWLNAVKSKVDLYMQSDTIDTVAEQTIRKMLATALGLPFIAEMPKTDDTPEVDLADAKGYNDVLAFFKNSADDMRVYAESVGIKLGNVKDPKKIAMKIYQQISQK